MIIDLIDYAAILCQIAEQICSMFLLSPDMEDNWSPPPPTTCSSLLPHFRCPPLYGLSESASQGVAENIYIYLYIYMWVIGPWPYYIMTPPSNVIRIWPADLLIFEYDLQICLNRNMTCRSPGIQMWPADLLESEYDLQISWNLHITCRYAGIRIWPADFWNPNMTCRSAGICILPADLPESEYDLQICWNPIICFFLSFHFIL